MVVVLIVGTNVDVEISASSSSSLMNNAAFCGERFGAKKSLCAATDDNDPAVYLHHTIVQFVLYATIENSRTQRLN